MNDENCCHHSDGYLQQLCSTLRNMVIWDWYDGPETGLLVCDTCLSEFYFFMIDWSNDHNVRIFALQPVEKGAVARLASLVDEEPLRPLWMPRRLKFPSELDLQWIDQLDQLVLFCDRKNPSKVLAWDNKTHKPLIMAEITDDNAAHVQQLLESDSVASPYDWFAYLGIHR